MTKCNISFQGASVRCERFLKVDQDAKSPREKFVNSQIVNRWMEKLEDFNSENPCPPEKTIQYTVAEIYASEYVKRNTKWDKTGTGAEPTEFKQNPQPGKFTKQLWIYSPPGTASVVHGCKPIRYRFGGYGGSERGT